MVAVVATFTGPADSLFNAAAAFAHAGAVKVSSQTPTAGQLVLEGKAESDDAVKGALAAIASMPGVKASATTSELPDEAQTDEEAAAVIAEAEANVAAFTAPADEIPPGAFDAPAEVPGAGADPGLVIPPVEPGAEPAAAEPEGPPTPIVPDLGDTEPFVVKLTGAEPADLVRQGQLVGQALTEYVNWAEPPTGWGDDGGWCLYGDTTLGQEALYAISVGAAPVVTVSALVGRENIRAAAEAAKKAVAPAAPGATGEGASGDDGEAGTDDENPPTDEKPKKAGKKGK